MKLINSKKVKMLILVMGAVFALGGCKKENNNVNNKNNGNANIQNENNDGNEKLSGTIVVTGSTSVEKILLDMIDEFVAVNPNLKINYTGTGSSAGIQDAINGTNSFGVSSRELKQEEIDQKIKAEVFAYEGIAVVVNPENKIENLTIEDLAKIYSGQIVNWKELGGDDMEIVVVSREGASGTRSAFEELIKLEAAGGLQTGATTVEGNGNVQNGVANNKNAIGYVSFSFINDNVKAVNIEEIEPNAANAKEGSYKLSRPFIFAFKEGSLSKESKAFIDFTKTEDAQVYVEEHGGIRID